VRSDFGNEFSVDGSQINRTVSFGFDHQDDRTVQLESRVHFATGPVRHQTLLGIEQARYDFGPYQFFNGPLDSLNIGNPVRGAQPGALTETGPADGYGAKSNALYLQDLISFGEQWKLLTGLRHERVESYSSLVPAQRLEQDQAETSPRAGVVYQPQPTTSLYASWARSFVPNSFSRSASGAVFAPERGVQSELGIKQDWLDSRLSTTFALFQIRRQNVLTSDLSTADPNDTVTTGEQRSRGVEVEAVGEVRSGWRLTASYSYIDAEITRDNSLPVGNRLQGVGKHSGAIWSKHSVWTGWSVGWGVTAVGRRDVQLPNLSLKVPGYAQWDAALYYELNPHRGVQLNIDNMFDRRVFQTQSYYGIQEDPGRTVSMRVHWRFG
jgi:iron complex outermembrane recepter protein